MKNKQFGMNSFKEKRKTSANTRNRTPVAKSNKSMLTTTKPNFVQKPTEDNLGVSQQIKQLNSVSSLHSEKSEDGNATKCKDSDHRKSGRTLSPFSSPIREKLLEEDAFINDLHTSPMSIFDD